MQSVPPPVSVFAAQALVEGPDTDVARQLIPFKRLALTDFKLPIQRNARIGTIRAAAKVTRQDATSFFFLSDARMGRT